MKKRSKNITISDIARELGVSTALVSLVLSGKSLEYRISEKAAKKVIETAKRLGYLPNFMAKALRTGKSGVLGLIVADISNPFFAKIAREIENEACKIGYQVMFASSDEDKDKFEDLGNTFIIRQVDGLIIAPVSDSQEVVSDWHARGVPIVFVDRYFSSLDIPYAVTDNFDASYQITTHIRERGFKKIAFIGKKTNVSTFMDREEGFISAAENTVLSKVDYDIFQLDNHNWAVELESMIRSILDEGYDIIYFTQNMLGISGLKILNDLGAKIPEDIAVISFDSTDVFLFNRPVITCFEQPLEELARSALSAMSALITNGEPDAAKSSVKLKGTLVHGNSC
jgi:LacI family transcriptional regulator